MILADISWILRDALFPENPGCVRCLTPSSDNARNKPYLVDTLLSVTIAPSSRPHSMTVKQMDRNRRSSVCVIPLSLHILFLLCLVLLLFVLSIFLVLLRVFLHYIALINIRFRNNNSSIVFYTSSITTPSSSAVYVSGGELPALFRSSNSSQNPSPVAHVLSTNTLPSYIHLSSFSP